MAWVRGIREVRYDSVATNERHGPTMERQMRVVVDLPDRAITETLRCRSMVPLPVHRGAGPCGTYARMRLYPLPKHSSQLPLDWSIQHLVAPLQAYYAAYRPPMRFGAKPGPRGRRAA